jgi:uncharacterized protein (DUF934 family)
MQVIKDGRIVADSWRHLSDDEPVPTTPCTVSAARWLREREELLKHEGPLGIRLTGDDRLEDFAADFERVPLIVVEFPTMVDGRGFSIARLLHERYGYKGEIRARGKFIRDQVFYLHRVGCNAFEFAEGEDLESILPLLHEFSVTYQAAADDPRPLYRRRTI